MTMTGTLHLQSVEGTGLRFEARFDSQSVVFDSGPGAVAPTPPQNLLGALAACMGMDVISILRKKRESVTAYEIVMEADRAATHPRRLTAIRLVHRVTGHGVREAAVTEAVNLSSTKYCSVYFTLDPSMPITSRVEILEG